MKTISVGELRQNPTAALDAVEDGETFIVTRHRREIARLVPAPRRRPVAAADILTVLDDTPVDPEWTDELRADRQAFDERADPWPA